MDAPAAAGVDTQFAGREDRVDGVHDQIEYPDEEPWIRERFESELAARGLESAMPPEAYQDPDYKWSYAAAAGS